MSFPHDNVIIIFTLQTRQQTIYYDNSATESHLSHAIKELEEKYLGAHVSYGSCEFTLWQ